MLLKTRPNIMTNVKFLKPVNNYSKGHHRVNFELVITVITVSEPVRYD